jgi:hypothetical protein
MIGMFDSLMELGADRGCLRLFDRPAPELLAYSAILAAHSHDEDLRLVECVYEWQEAPLVFLVDGDKLNGNSEQLRRVRRILAMRGDAPYLGVVYPGRLDVYRIALDRHSLAKVRVNTGVADNERWLTFARLGNLRPAAEINDRTWITGVILRLLDQAISFLKTDGNLSGEDAISLVGRALFMRFLADRGLLPPISDIIGDDAGGDVPGLEEHDLFDRPNLVRLSCLWLDDTFNGELLPLSEAVFPALTVDSCRVLGNILRRAEGGQLSLGWKEGWGDLDFSHIPVGVLSQAYEHYQRKHAPTQQQQEGGYYTPHPIANLMISAAFRGLDAQGASATARILDPAAGAGVFLLAAFRYLVAARWRSDKQRPDTAALREILYKQLRGFDTNEAALRFCALGLYLMSIELDPNPRPVDKLHFDDLRGVVLYRPVDIDRPETKQLGSLGPLVGAEHDGQYDLVIGNPPWASATGLEDWSVLLADIHTIARSRLGDDIAAPPLPNAVLDLPFVWRAMRWAKPDAQIVFALHARFLFQQGDGMPLARQSLLEAIDITSIINGSELRQTKVWPSISAPFCLLFAANRPAHTASGFRILTPRLEKSFNNAGAMRVDATNAYVVRPRDLRERPETLKILFRGSEADLSLIDRVRRGKFPTLRHYWSTLGEGCLAHGNGYQSLRPSSKKNDDGTVGEDAADLYGIPHLYHDEDQGLVISAKSLPVFETARLHRKRRREIYDGPLLLIHQSPPVDLQRIRMSVCDNDLIYNESWYGFSAKRASNASVLIRYMVLLLGSRMALWMSLITSGKFGFERDVIEKSVVEEIVIPPFEGLEPDRVHEAELLFARLEKEGNDVWSDVDAWVAKLYGLGERDLTVINDTLRFNLPYAANRELAQSEPTIPQIKTYCRTLEAELTRFAQRFHCKVRVDPAHDQDSSPWRALHVVAYRDSEEDKAKSAILNIRALTAVADRASATEIIVDEGDQRLAVVLLAQARYWSETQARLAAQRIIWTRAELFRGRPSL